MTYTCPICKENINGGLIDYAKHGDNHVIELLKYDHPEWVEKDGTCNKCYMYYKAEIEGSVYKDVPCVKRSRFVKKVFRSIKKVVIKLSKKQ